MEEIADRMMCLYEFEAVRDWRSDVKAEGTGSAPTEKAYLRHAMSFSEWTGRTPDELIAEAKAKLKEDPNSRSAERLARRWFNHLVSEKGLSRNTGRSRYGVIRSFFRHNGVRFTGKCPRAAAMTRYAIPEKADLKRIWRMADAYEKIRMGVLNDTGMRPSDAVRLVYADVRESFERGEDMLYIEKVSGKEEVRFAVCLTRTTTALLRDHMAHRIRGGEELGDGSPIITESLNHGRPIGVNQLWRDVHRLGETVGIRLSPKAFRKRFRTYCSPVIGRDAVMRMGGWKIPGAGSHYFLPPKAKTVEDYRKVEGILSLGSDTENVEFAAQRRMASEMLRAAGANPELLLEKADIGDGTKEQADYLTKHLVGLLNIVKAVNNVSGGSPPK